MSALDAIDRRLTPNANPPKHSRVFLAGGNSNLATGVQGLKCIPNCDAPHLVLMAIDVFLLKHVNFQLFKQFDRFAVFHPLNPIVTLSDTIERFLTSYMVPHYKCVVKVGS